MIRHVASALIVGGLLAPWASAQDPNKQPPPSPYPDGSSTLFPPIPTDPAHPAYHPNAHKSIVRHNPLPRRTSYNSYYPYTRSGSSQGQSGFSTGGVGRYAEFYDANTPTSQVDQHAVPVAQFDKGGGPDRAEQISAYQAGTQRAQVIQNGINAYGRPFGAYGAGFGYGLGLSGGTLYNYPY